jgi:anti-anti-sigma regulatory factor
MLLMYAESLDITILKHQGEIWIILSGPFKKDQVPGFREKFVSLINEGNRFFVVDLQQLTQIDDAVVHMFLQVLSLIKGKGGSLKLIYKSETVSKAFQPYQHTLSIFPDASLFNERGLVASFKRRSKFLTRKTGIRFSRPVALFLLFILSGWFFTLLFTIHIQNRNLKLQQQELNELTQWKQRSVLEINSLRERLLPLEQLGIIRDTIQ